jgi:hypothetical protein
MLDTLHIWGTPFLDELKDINHLNNDFYNYHIT